MTQVFLALFDKYGPEETLTAFADAAKILGDPGPRFSRNPDPVGLDNYNKIALDIYRLRNALRPNKEIK